LFDNLHSDYYWTSTEVANNADKATAFTFSGAYAYTGYDKTTGLYAMAVHPGNIASAVPEPETYMLFLAGLGLLGWRTQRQKLISL
jgi:hypothetical protein